MRVFGRVIALAAAAMLWTTAGQAQSFDCSTSAAKKCPESAICKSRDLSQKDEVMARLYTKLSRMQGPAKAKDLKEDQRDWLGKRNKCGCETACLTEAYSGQIRTLGKIAFEGPDAAKDPQVGKWTTLGTHTVKVFKTDKDTVTVGRNEGFFTHINMKVSRNDVNFSDVKVVYGNDEEDTLQVRKLVKAGSETGPIELDRDKFKARVIKRIEVTYQSGKWWRGRARVVFEGKQG